MKLYTLGVNHETAPIDVRETISFSPETALRAALELKEKSLISECIILSTCNRTEIYCRLKNDHQPDDMVAWLHQFFT
ncbi:hypothetical protein [Thiomicrorhabdus aquaedulcis]|uniref:hypothetical protein n=1 Tax=Thiomicrorhabdus aquaedulcis TaxID=2211106 RepID=UPI0030B80F00